MCSRIPAALAACPARPNSLFCCLHNGGTTADEESGQDHAHGKPVQLVDEVVGQPKLLESSSHLLQPRYLFDVITGQGEPREVFEVGHVDHLVDAVGRNGKSLHPGESTQHRSLEFVDGGILG